MDIQSIKHAINCNNAEFIIIDTAEEVKGNSSIKVFTRVTDELIEFIKGNNLMDYKLYVVISYHYPSILIRDNIIRLHKFKSVIHSSGLEDYSFGFRDRLESLVDDEIDTLVTRNGVQVISKDMLTNIFDI